MKAFLARFRGNTSTRLCYGITLSAVLACYVILFLRKTANVVITPSQNLTTVTSSSEATSSEEARFLRTAEQRYKERTSTVLNTCRIFNKTNCSKRKKFNPNGLFSSNYECAVCAINKVSSSSWLQTLAVMDDMYTADDYRQKKVRGDEFVSRMLLENSFVVGSKFRFKDAASALETWQKYLKIVTVRDPFHRIVSAFNDKMRPEASGFSYKYGNMSLRINSDFRHLRADGGAARNDTTATFEDFVNFLLYDDKTTYPRTDPHWATYAAVCDPCLHRYGVITKFETFQEDMRYLELRLRIDDRHKAAFFPARTPRTDGGQVEAMFRTIPRQRALALYEMFKFDFMMFGYERPRWLDDAWDC